MNNVLFKRNSLEEYSDWAVQDRKKFLKIKRLIEDIQRHPFEGLGKPEPLKYDLSGYWSREITEGDRIVYRVVDDTLEIISCKYHYTEL